MRVRDVAPGALFKIVDKIDGERRETYYQRREGAGDGRFVPTTLFGFQQWDRDGEVRVLRMDKNGTPQMTDGLAVCQGPP
jgi:hypothetical protein